MRERVIQAEIMEAIGCEPDIIVMRNSNGLTREFDPESGKTRVLRYGLGPGSPDLVCILRRELAGETFGQWLGLEVKRPGEKPSLEQRQCHEAWRWCGAFVASVTSAEAAKAALQKARRGDRR